MQPIRPGLDDVGELGLGREAAQPAELGTPGPTRQRVQGIAVMQDRVPQPDAAMRVEDIEPLDFLDQLFPGTP